MKADRMQGAASALTLSQPVVVLDEMWLLSDEMRAGLRRRR